LFHEELPAEAQETQPPELNLMPPSLERKQLRAEYIALNL
jgi:hypothetical protein